MYSQTLTLSSVGQITIPRSIRELLGLEKGSRFDVAVDQKSRTITLKKRMNIDEVIAELKEIDKKYPTPKPDPKYRHMSVGEMSLELMKEATGDSWV